ncbi:unnamed protein product [Rotaria sp. Silwood2]|nr:unnamed protein product [Rotaria sp. Silwood2]CAF4196520.1 unnamed protein product [Rotaria sp. Silwood2]
MHVTPILFTQYEKIRPIGTPEMSTNCRQLKNIRSRETDQDKRAMYDKRILTTESLLEEANLYISSNNKTQSKVNIYLHISYTVKLD